MSAVVGLDKFYKSSLTTPRIYADVKLNEERVDSPTLDPFLSSTTRRRHLGQMEIMEPNLNKLKADPDNLSDKRKQCEVDQIDRNVSNVSSSSSLPSSSPCGVVSCSNLSTPPAPVAIKRRRRILSLVADVDEERESEGGEEKKNFESEDCGGAQNRQFPVRKLWDEFNSVATEDVKDSGTPVCRRTSPRLVKPRLR